MEQSTSKIKNGSDTFLDSLQEIALLAKKQEEIKIKKIFSLLSGKGYAALLILFSLPFCIPQIPGFSTPFGIILAFIGLRIAFAKNLWWPKWILEKNLSSKNVLSIAETAIKGVKKLQKLIHPRWIFLAKNPMLHRLHGLLIFFLAILLSLPLPIPFTNLLTAFPILFMGLGLLEDDGLFIIISYILSLICFLTFLGLFLLGKALIF